LIGRPQEDSVGWLVIHPHLLLLYTILCHQILNWDYDFSKDQMVFVSNLNLSILAESLYIDVEKLVVPFGKAVIVIETNS
jgi:uncharacterized membrane protein